MFNITQRQVGLSLIILLLFCTVITCLVELVGGRDQVLLIVGAAAILVYGSLIAAYWRGWRYANEVLTIFLTFGVASLGTLSFAADNITLVLLLPSVVALILLNPLWIVGSNIVAVVVLLVRTGGEGIYTTPLGWILHLLIVGGLVLARMVADTAQRAAIANGQRAEVALVETERQAHELAQRASDLEANNEQQRRLLDLVTTLETPAVALADGVVLAPIVGHLDSRRAEALTERLLHEVSQRRTRVVILDIAGVSTVDTAVAQSLLRAVQALRLLGCEVNLTGISSSVATTITYLGIDLDGVSIARTPQDALANIALINRATKAQTPVLGV